MSMDDQDLMVSFNVVSLFTKVPIEEALEIIHTQLQEDQILEERTNIPPDQICRLTEMFLRSTYFQVGSDFYEQIEGAAMGSPLSPIIANLYMEFFEEEVLNTSIHKPKLWVEISN